MDILTEKQQELLDAIDKGDFKKVKRLVKVEGVDPNFGSSTYIENNPICWASLSNEVDIAFWLIQKGGAKLSDDIFRFVTCVAEDISTSNLIFRRMGGKFPFF